MSNRFRLSHRAALAAVAAAGLTLAVPATAFASTSQGQQKPQQQPGPNKDLALHQVNLGSDVPGMSPLTDPDLKNPWGLAMTPASPLWVADQGADASTLYQLNADHNTVTKSTAVRVTMADSMLGSSGAVANTGQGFVLSHGTTKAPAAFMFATLDGHIEAWSPTVDPHIGNTEDKATVAGAGFTGLALASTHAGDRLLAADFNAPAGKIDAFDSSFHQVKLASWQFTDPHLPQAYHAFNVQELNGNIFVTYDTPDPVTMREGIGAGIGIVDEYTNDGQLVARVAAGGTLNAPWGLAIAPSSWGKDAGALLVGNFGDGKISFFAKEGSHFAKKATGQVTVATTGKPFAEPGLWALLPGTPANGGTNSVWFTAGINHEQDGLLGLLRP
jgi:uncharacterized protein (TIGR03118 family)